MADEQHIYLLKRGVETWNQWRKEHPDIQPNLHEADFCGDHLSKADLHKADLSESYLSKASLVGSYLYQANLNGAHLFGTDFRRANLNEARLRRADLRKADLSGAYLRRVNLTDADLSGTILNEANLRRADLTGAIMDSTIFGDVDLRLVKGLEMVKHRGPSIISIDTIYRSNGEIPEAFLRGTGVPDTMIDYVHSLVGQSIEYHTCFISYSNKDHVFVESLDADLRSRGVRCWFAPEDMKIGDKIRPSIDEAIRHYNKLLLVLSDNSVESDWVEKEVETAFEKERQQKCLVLFPIRLDDTVIHTSLAWAADIRRTRHIGDFTKWKNHNDYQKAFARLLRDLKADI